MDTQFASSPRIGFHKVFHLRMLNCRFLNDSGNKISAGSKNGASADGEILVLDDAVTVDEARNMLWRRERRREGTGETYVEGKTASSVLVREWSDSPCVERVLYTDFNPEGKVAKPEAGELAQKAIQSVKAAQPGMDGITYLKNNMASGIKTKLSTDYEAEILKQTNTASLEGTLRKAKEL